MPKSWTIDQGQEFLQGPHVLHAYIAHLEPLFPEVDVPTPAGDIKIGVPHCANTKTFLLLLSGYKMRASTRFRTRVPHKGAVWNPSGWV